MKWKIALLALMLILSCGLIGGCSISDGPTLPDVPDISVDANSITPFAGVLVSRNRYNYLLRCEGYVIRSGVNP